MADTSLVSPGAKVTIEDYSNYTSATSSSVIGIVGPARKGPLTPTLVTTIAEFIQQFGEPDGSSYGAYGAIYYLKQGNQVYYQRVIHGGSAASAGDIGMDMFTVKALSQGTSMNGYKLAFIVSADNKSVDVTLTDPAGNQVESYAGLSTDPNATNFITKVISIKSTYVELDYHSTGALSTKTLTLSGGVDGGTKATASDENVVFSTRTFDSTLNGARVKLSKKDFTGYFDYTLSDPAGNTIESYSTVSDDPTDARYLPSVLSNYSNYISLVIHRQVAAPTIDSTKYQGFTLSMVKE